jgi:hypothetical protein
MYFVRHVCAALQTPKPKPPKAHLRVRLQSANRERLVKGDLDAAPAQLDVLRANHDGVRAEMRERERETERERERKRGKHK